MQGQGIKVKIRVLLTMLAALIVLAALSGVAGASPEAEASRRIDTKNVTRFTEATGLDEEDKHAVKEAAKEETREEKADEGGAPAEGEEGGEEHQAAWMIPGWQSIFAALAVAYYALAVMVLPKIMAKEEHH